MAAAKLNLEIITQESHILSDVVDAVSVPTVTGELTILPHHISLFTKLTTGEIHYQKAGHTTDYVVSGGFMEVSGGKIITILADSAIRSDQIDIAKAEAAQKRAEELLKQKASQQDLLMAEADLRRALMELKVARRKKIS